MKNQNMNDLHIEVNREGELTVTGYRSRALGEALKGWLAHYIQSVGGIEEFEQIALAFNIDRDYEFNLKSSLDEDEYTVSFEPSITNDEFLPFALVICALDVEIEDF